MFGVAGNRDYNRPDWRVEKKLNKETSGVAGNRDYNRDYRGYFGGKDKLEIVCIFTKKTVNF